MERMTEKNETYDFDELTKKMEEECGIYTEKTHCRYILKSKEMKL